MLIVAFSTNLLWFQLDRDLELNFNVSTTSKILISNSIFNVAVCSTDFTLNVNVLLLVWFLQTKGLQCLPRLVLFTSADAHYSVKKLASFMGMGTDNVYLINTDSNGKMDAGHLGNWFGMDSRFNSIKSLFRFLESEILRAQTEGALPFMVSATAGNETCFTLCTRWWLNTLWIDYVDEQVQLFWAPLTRSRRSPTSATNTRCGCMLMRLGEVS